MPGVAWDLHASPEIISAATTAAHRALELDETLAEAHASLAFIKFRFDWDWPGAELEFRRALDLNPNLAQTRHWHAMFLATRRRFDEALAEIGRAQDLDPLSLVVQCGVGRILHFAGRYAEAEAEFGRLLNLDPSFSRARLDLTMTLFALGRYREAREGLERTDSSSLGASAKCSPAMRRPWKVTSRLRAGHWTRFASTFAGRSGAGQIVPLPIILGEMDEAYRLVAEAIRLKSTILVYVNVEPLVGLFLTVPGVRELFREHGLLLD